MTANWYVSSSVAVCIEMTDMWSQAGRESYSNARKSTDLYITCMVANQQITGQASTVALRC